MVSMILTELGIIALKKKLGSHWYVVVFPHICVVTDDAMFPYTH